MLVVEVKVPLAAAGQGTCAHDHDISRARGPCRRRLPRLQFGPGQQTPPNIMLLGLSKPLTTYDSFPMTLVFEKAGKLDIEVIVEEAQ